MLDANGIDPNIDGNDATKLSHKKVEHCLALFLEEAAGQKYLGNGIIC